MRRRQREIAKRLHRKAQPDPESQTQMRTQPAVGNTVKPKRRQEREEDHQRKISSLPQNKLQPDSESQRAVAKKTKLKKTVMQERDEYYQRRSNHTQRKSHVNQKQRDLQHQGQEQAEHQIIPDVEKSHDLIMKRPPAVIDLVSSDSESESDRESSENDLLLALTQLLQDEVIGRGANHNEMQVYAQHMFRLGLHSREMILDALDFNLNDLHDDNNTKLTKTDMASDTVNRWEWMKPFHKTVFYRWVWLQQQRQRKVSTQI
jgi:hypothetical protein